jgi:hypothetical protein
MIRRASLARVLGTLALGASLLGLPLRAAADGSSDERAQWPALLRAGIAASKAKDWPACIDAYSRAVKIEESAHTFGELGLCEEAAGRFASAHPHLKRAVAGIAPGDERRERYQAALGRVAELVAIVVITVTPTDARVVIDGRPLGRGEGRNVAIEPGRHVFAARLAGYEDASKTLTVNAREIPHLELSLKPLPAGFSSAASSPAISAGPAPAESGASSSLPVPFRWCMPAWSARGVLGPAACTGLVALAASTGPAIGLTAHWQSMRDAIVARGSTAGSCATGPAATSAECLELHARRLQRDTAQDVLIGTGIAAGVLLGAAGVAIALEHPSPRVSVNASADGGGIVLQGTW